MKELIKNVYEHRRNNDPKICFFMMEFIKNRKIVSLEDLKQREEDSFTSSEGRRFTDSEIIEKLYEKYNDDYDDYMRCSIEDQKKIDNLNEKFLNTEDVDTKYISLIKIYTILDWDLALPYHTYKYILEDRL